MGQVRKRGTSLVARDDAVARECWVGGSETYFTCSIRVSTAIIDRISRIERFVFPKTLAHSRV
jgi:hypothetical protein